MDVRGNCEAERTGICDCMYSVSRLKVWIFAERSDGFGERRSVFLLSCWTVEGLL